MEAIQGATLLHQRELFSTSGHQQFNTGPFTGNMGNAQLNWWSFHHRQRPGPLRSLSAFFGEQNIRLPAPLRPPSSDRVVATPVRAAKGQNH